MLIIRIFIFILVLFSSYSFSQETYILFNKLDKESSESHPEYNEILKKIKQGDILEFSDGKRFIIGKQKFSNEGGLTLVLTLEDEPDSVLRLSMKSNKIHQDLLNEFIEGYSVLKDQKIETVQIKDYIKNEYIKVSKLPEDSVVLDFVLTHFNQFSEIQKSKMRKAFLDFVLSASLFITISDFHAGQMAYSESLNKWILFDWADMHELATKPSDRFKPNFLDEAFDMFYSKDGNKWIKEIQAEAASLIKEDRFKKLMEKNINCFKKNFHELKF